MLDFLNKKNIFSNYLVLSIYFETNIQNRPKIKVKEQRWHDPYVTLPKSGDPDQIGSLKSADSVRNTAESLQKNRKQNRPVNYTFMVLSHKRIEIQI